MCIRDSRYAFQQLQHVVGCVRLCDPGENLLDAVAVGIRVPVGHRIHYQHNIVTMIVSAARRRFHAGARRNACHEHLRRAALPQVIIQRCADERTHSLFANQMIAGLLLQFRNRCV